MALTLNYWAEILPPNIGSGSRRLKTLLLSCLLDGEAYGRFFLIHNNLDSVDNLLPENPMDEVIEEFHFTVFIVIFSPQLTFGIFPKNEFRPG